MEKANEIYEKAKVVAKCKAKKANDFVTGSPYKAVACGVIVGVLAGTLAGLLLRRKKSNE